MEVRGSWSPAVSIHTHSTDLHPASPPPTPPLTPHHHTPPPRSTSHSLQPRTYSLGKRQEGERGECRLLIMCGFSSRSENPPPLEPAPTSPPLNNTPYPEPRMSGPSPHRASTKCAFYFSPLALPLNTPASVSLSRRAICSILRPLRRERGGVGKRCNRRVTDKKGVYGDGAMG